MSDLGTYEMLWDCEYCGTKKLLGLTHRFCPNCGAAQNPAKRYFPSDAEKVAVQNHKYVGEDKICPNCEGLNSGNAEFCGTCGAPLTDAARAKRLKEETRREGESFKEGVARDLIKENFEADMARIKKSQKSGLLKKPAFLAALLAAVFACCIICAGAFYLLTVTEDKTVEVVGHSWEREIEIMTYQTVSESDWDEDVPRDAKSVSCSREQRDTRRIQTGEECTTRRIDNGDGTFRERRECEPTYREEPVYDQYCEYKIDKWVVTDREKTSGDNFSEQPAWPSLNLTNSGGNCLGCQKEGDREEKYKVKFRDSANGKIYTCDYDRVEDWQKYAPETQWTVKVTKYGGVIECDTLKPL